MEHSTIIGMDIAKRSFALHGASQDGSKVFGKSLKRDKVLDFLSEQPACLVAIECCGGAHFLARSVQALNHEVKLIPAAVVKRYLAGQKNDANDAATNADAALSALDAFEESDLGMRYPDVVRRWRARWELVIPFLAFSNPIRKVLYTTNAIKSLNASVRRAVKVRGHFTSVDAAKKLIFLALREATKKWGSPIQCWDQARREFAIYFGERFDASCGCVSSRGSSEALKRGRKMTE